jgi:hypothetical protein
MIDLLFYVKGLNLIPNRGAAESQATMTKETPVSKGNRPNQSPDSS